MELKGKIAVVTGASSGIGLATAELLTQSGAKVAIVAQSQRELDKISERLPASFPIATDLRHEDNARQMIGKVRSHYGTIDILINNAGRNYATSIEQMETEKMREIFELNVFTPVALMQVVIPIMRMQGEGSIVNISSGTVFMQPFPGRSVYVASKRALVTFGLFGREELKKDNIIVSTVYPYITETNFYKNTMNAGANTQIPKGDGKIPPLDSAAFVAETILWAIEIGEAEVFAHDWMKQMQVKQNAH